MRRTPRVQRWVRSAANASRGATARKRRHVVTLFPPVRSGARTGPVTLGTDGAIWTIGGTVQETMGRYATSGVTTGIPVPANDLIALLPSSGGTFWVAKPVLCIGQPTAICLRIDRFLPGATTATPYIFPVAVNLGGAHQLGVDSTGSLWEAGGERSQPDRFFRMRADGTTGARHSPPAGARPCTPMGPSRSTLTERSGRARARRQGTSTSFGSYRPPEPLISDVTAVACAARTACTLLPESLLDSTLVTQRIEYWNGHGLRACVRPTSRVDSSSS